MFLSNWLRPRCPRTVARRTRRIGRFIRPQLEILEDRLTPSNYTAGNAAQLAADIAASDNTQSTITLSASFQLTSDLTLQNTSGLTIDGAGYTLTAAAKSGLFTVASGANVTFQNLTLTGGNASQVGSYLGGGAIEDLGGKVSLSGVKVTGNTITGTTENGDGGGVYVSQGTLTLLNSNFSNNVAQGGNGFNGSNGGVSQNGETGGIGGFGQGGGLYSLKSTLTIVNSSFTNNAARGGNGGQGGNAGSGDNAGSGGPGGNGGDGQGGGIYSAASPLLMVNTTVSGNTVQGGSGGSGGNGFTFYFGQGRGGAGGNGGNGQGGGVYDSASTPNSYLNNTVADNTASAGTGGVTGGVTLGTTGGTGSGGTTGGTGSGGTTGGTGSDASPSVVPLTGGVPGSASGGGIYVNASAPTFVNNLLQANAATSSGPDYDGPVNAAATNNFVSNDSGADTFASSSNILNDSTNQLGSFTTAANRTSYYPLLPGVQSINGGANSVLPTIANAEDVPVADAIDQIGNPRVDSVAKIIDIGAIEFQPEPTSVSVSPVNTTFNCMANQVTLSAQVTDGDMTVTEGAVTFTVASATGTGIGTVANVAVVNGVATTPFTIPANTPAGTYTIAASYSDPLNSATGTGGRFGNSSGNGALTIAPAPTTVTPGDATAPFSPSPQTTSATVAVTSPDCPAVDEGTVTVTLDENTLGAGTVSNGSANVSLTIPASLPVGTYTLTEDYTDSAGNFLGSSGDGTLTLVSSGPVTVAVADPEVSFPNTDPTITLAATLSVNGALVTEGQVQFTVIGLTSQPITVPVVNGQASTPFAVPAKTPVGTYTVAASYHDSAGNYQNGAGTSSLTVLPSASTVTINNVGIVYGLFSEQQTLSAVARDPNGVVINEGAVTFTDAGQTITAPIVNGLATVTLTIPLMAENPFAHSITVAYNDISGNFLAGTSQFMLQQTIMDFLFQVLALEFYLQSSSGNP